MFKIRTHEEFLKEVYEKYKNEYIVLSRYELCSKKVKIRHNIKDCMHEYWVTPNNFLRGRKCPKCKAKEVGKRFSSTFEDFLERFKNANNRNKFNYIGGFTKVHNTFDIECKECGYIFQANIRNIERNKDKSIICPCCDLNSKLINTDTVHHYLKYTEEDEYILIGEYKNAKSNITVHHTNCNRIFNTTFDAFKTVNCRCPYCKSSKGEKFLRGFLEKNNIKFESQYSMPDCKDIRVLPFDFSILKNDGSIDFLIEVDSIIHHKYIKFIHKTYDKFIDKQKKDKIKEDYCKNNNIKLYKPYYNKIKDIEIWIKDNENLFVKGGD